MFLPTVVFRLMKLRPSSVNNRHSKQVKTLFLSMEAAVHDRLLKAALLEVEFGPPIMTEATTVQASGVVVTAGTKLNPESRPPQNSFVMGKDKVRRLAWNPSSRQVAPLLPHCHS